MSPTESPGLEPIKKDKFNLQLEGADLDNYIMGVDSYDETSEEGSLAGIATMEVFKEEVVEPTKKGAIETELENKGPGLRALRAYYKTIHKRASYNGYHKVPSIQ